eukprot:COSAG01_NODE_63733_length_279_cov_0.544444_1_plen_25_part_01
MHPDEGVPSALRARPRDSAVARSPP